MFGLIAAMMALAIPASTAGLAENIESGASSAVLDSDLVGMWYEAFVAPDGTIEGCTVRAAMGDGEAAKAVCKDIVGRHVKPAVGADGHATYGYFREPLNFADNLEPMSLNAVPADLAIQVKALPAGMASRVGVTVAVGADGKVLACQPDEGSSGLSRAACDQVRMLALPVRKARGGQAVSYLYPMIVQFEQDRG